ncbi:MAG: complex I NDUFA9 subunit family protein [Pseudomonadota bacterium]
MVLNGKKIVVFGGNGFIGQYLVNRLVKLGAMVIVFARSASKCNTLKALGYPGQVVLIDGDVTSENEVHNVVAGADYVVNLIGVLAESGKYSFNEMHVNVPGRIALHAYQTGVSHLIHVSALGVRRGGRSEYLKSKERGEKEVLANFNHATILRPSVVFGDEDNFINQFELMSRFLPVIALPLAGATKFQPVFVDDVANAITKVITNEKYQGHVYELGGPEIISLKDVVELILKVVKRCRLILPLSRMPSLLMASILSLLPGRPILTKDQLKSLAIANVTSTHQKNAHGFSDLGIEPISLSRHIKQQLVGAYN